MPYGAMVFVLGVEVTEFTLFHNVYSIRYKVHMNNLMSYFITVAQFTQYRIVSYMGTQVVHSLRVNPMTSGYQVIKKTCSTQLQLKFILLVDVKIPTIVGIFTFISRLNAKIESLKATELYFFTIVLYMSNLKSVHSWVDYRKCFITSGPGNMVT